ncbi:unnamed protein product (mitochondrion) [Plasmodiophora brassicae]|uniref:Uncharacterized protein n=1 Tax=Plasmodiophora brassicae TaxID=37360 RepID=A0A0G4ITJ7_PLABS|nr:hypothetical protein PBRA_006728 [Plasmodiophora brassicae]SPR00744.1 unnamed protein product [Plasmodiophora brassicae]
MTLLRCKVVVVGDARVGKSALTQNFHSSVYPKNYVMTLGVDFSVKAVPIAGSGNTVELFVFDTSGEEMYDDIRRQCCANANQVIAAFDMAERSTYDNAKHWIAKIRDDLNRPGLPGVLVACKSDLKEFADVPTKEASDYAKSIGLEYFECSALEGKNVEAPFLYIANAFNASYEGKLEELASEL